MAAGVAGWQKAFYLRKHPRPVPHLADVTKIEKLVRARKVS